MVDGISNPAFRFGGLATGIDTESLIAGLLQIQRRPLALIETRRERTEAKIDAFTALRAQLVSLAGSLSGLERSSELDALKVTSSAAEVVRASASRGAAEGSYSLRVDSLATRGRVRSQGFASPQAIVGGGSIQVVVGGKTHTIPVADSSTVADLRDAINAADVGVTATLVDTGQGANPHQLVIAAGLTGTENTILADGIDTTNLVGGHVQLSFSQLTEATNARVEIDGLLVTRSDNHFDDVIEGVSLEFQDDHQGAAFTLTVGRDGGAIADRIEAFVDGLNEVLATLDAHSDFDPERGASGVLFSENLLRRTRDRLMQGTLGTSLATQPGFESLASIGITLGSNQRFQVDRATLEEKIGADFDAVARLFAEGPSGSASTPDGIAHVLGSHLEDLTANDDGWIESRLQGLERIADSYEEQVERGERRLDRFEDLLRARFASLEVLVSGLQAQARFL